MLNVCKCSLPHRGSSKVLGRERRVERGTGWENLRKTDSSRHMKRRKNAELAGGSETHIEMESNE